MGVDEYKVYDFEREKRWLWDENLIGSEGEGGWDPSLRYVYLSLTKRSQELYYLEWLCVYVFIPHETDGSTPYI